MPKSVREHMVVDPTFSANLPFNVLLSPDDRAIAAGIDQNYGVFRVFFETVAEASLIRTFVFIVEDTELPDEAVYCCECTGWQSAEIPGTHVYEITDAPEDFDWAEPVSLLPPPIIID